MKERMSDPMSTVRSTISIVLNVFFFCILLSPYWLLTFVERFPEWLGVFWFVLVCLLVSPVFSGFLPSLL
jgi:hypothetical protein